MNMKSRYNQYSAPFIYTLSCSHGCRPASIDPPAIAGCPIKVRVLLSAAYHLCLSRFGMKIDRLVVCLGGNRLKVTACTNWHVHALVGSTVLQWWGPIPLLLSSCSRFELRLNWTCTWRVYTYSANTHWVVSSGRCCNSLVSSCCCHSNLFVCSRCFTTWYAYHVIPHLFVRCLWTSVRHLMICCHPLQKQSGIDLKFIHYSN